MGYLVEFEEIGAWRPLRQSDIDITHFVLLLSTKSGQSRKMKLHRYVASSSIQPAPMQTHYLNVRKSTNTRFETPPNVVDPLPESTNRGRGASLVNISHFTQKTFNKYNLFTSKSYMSVDGHESKQRPGGGIQPQGVVSIFDSAADYKVEGSHPRGPFSLCAGYFQQICYIKYSPRLPVCFPAK